MKTNFNFSAINPYIETNIVSNKETIQGELIKWGTDNKYPSYLMDLYKNVPTLKAVVDTYVNYITGDGIEGSFVNKEELVEIIEEFAKSYVIYGGAALNILRNRLGIISKICVMDFRTVRKSTDDKIFLYSKSFGDNCRSRSTKIIKIPAFDPEDKTQLSSIVYISNSKYTNYPTPIYEAAIKACEIEKSIDEYHLNAINNGFVSSAIVNLNNGIPDDEMKQEIEEMFTNKFTGKENAGRVIISFNNDKEHGATIEKVDTDDFSERYNTLATRSKQSIFTAFRITPTLVGIPTENNGFSAEQYKEQYVLFYTTVIRSIQKLIIRTLSNILETEIKIIPFKLDFDDATNITDVK